MNFFSQTVINFVGPYFFNWLFKILYVYRTYGNSMCHLCLIRIICWRLNYNHKTLFLIWTRNSIINNSMIYLSESLQVFKLNWFANARKSSSTPQRTFYCFVPGAKRQIHGYCVVHSCKYSAICMTRSHKKFLKNYQFGKSKCKPKFGILLSVEY